MPIPRKSDFLRDPRNVMPKDIPTVRGFKGPESPQAQILRNLDGTLVPYYGADSGYIPPEDVPADDDDVSFINHDRDY